MLINDLSPLEKARAIDGATHQDNAGRWYAKELGKPRKYGYNTYLEALYVCYTCGHLCECGEGE